jgi:uncharacterized OB-fold protein
LISYTVNYQPREGFERSAPHIIGLVKLEEGLELVAPLVDVDPDELREGMEVRACLRRAVSDSSTGIIQYIIKFGPARNGD